MPEFEVPQQFAREETGRISPEHPRQCDLSPLRDALAGVRFPISKQDLLGRVGNIQLTCQGGDQHPLSELVSPMTKDQFNSLEDLQDALAHPVLG